MEVTNNNYILIVGCTGVGKSTVYDFLCKTYNDYIAFADPYVDNPFIANAYSDGNKSFQSEVFFFKEFLKIHKAISLAKNRRVIQERSIFECVEIFCKIFMHSGKMDQNEFTTMKDFLSVVEEWIRIPDTILYLKADDNVIYERIKLRNRDFEQEIDRDFIHLQKCLYDEWLTGFCHDYCVKLIEIDNSKMNISETNRFVSDSLGLT